MLHVKLPRASNEAPEDDIQRCCTSGLVECNTSPLCNIKSFGLVVDNFWTFCPEVKLSVSPKGHG